MRWKGTENEKKIKALFEVDEKILREMKETKTYAEIGEVFGVHPSSVARVYSKTFSPEMRVYIGNETIEVNQEKVPFSDSEDDYGDIDGWMGSSARVTIRSANNEQNYVDKVKEYLNKMNEL